MSEGLWVVRFPGVMLIHHRGAKAEHQEKALMMCVFPPKGQKTPKQNKKKNRKSFSGVFAGRTSRRVQRRPL